MWNDSLPSTSADTATVIPSMHDPTVGSITISADSWLLGQIILGVSLLLVCILCVVGNVLVILAVCLERELRGRPQCYLIFSLAFADLVVGLFVTPLSAWTTVTGRWHFGMTMCDAWIFGDVLMCTASILHLVAIALDRYRTGDPRGTSQFIDQLHHACIAYWSITDICYVQNRTPRRVIGMLFVIWVVSLLISLLPVLGWKDDDFTKRLLGHDGRPEECLVSQSISYQVFSTSTAFYIPLLLIIIVYWKIMRAAKKRFKRERDRRTVHRAPSVDASKKVPLIKKCSSGSGSRAPPPPAVLIPADNVTQNGISTGKESTSSTSDEDHRILGNGAHRESETRLDSVVLSTNGSAKSSLKGGMVMLTKKRTKKPKESIEMKRERKAWRTLAIITGTFVACWTPFFLLSVYRPIAKQYNWTDIPVWLETTTNWLGYLNSALNPIIYTVFSQDFRLAFKKILKRLCFIHDY